MLLRTLFIIAAMATLAGCTTPHSAIPAGCDGHHRRPANPDGSVLDTSAPSWTAGKVGASGGAPLDGCGISQGSASPTAQ